MAFVVNLKVTSLARQGRRDGFRSRRGFMGRHYIPQPFLSYLERINLTETWFPDGYVGHLYEITQNFDRTPVVSIVAGALPPGLGLSIAANSLTITGTPTTVGAYDFTIRFISGVVATDYLDHITINAGSGRRRRRGRGG